MALKVAQYVIIGSRGSDAGYWVLDATGLHHVGGWGIDQLREVTNGLQIMGTATQFKTQGLAQTVTKSVADFVTKQLETNLGKVGGEAGATVIIVAG